MAEHRFRHSSSFEDRRVTLTAKDNSPEAIQRAKEEYEAEMRWITGIQTDETFTPDGNQLQSVHYTGDRPSIPSLFRQATSGTELQAYGERIFNISQSPLPHRHSILTGAYENEPGRSMFWRGADESGKRYCIELTSDGHLIDHSNSRLGFASYQKEIEADCDSNGGSIDGWGGKYHEDPDALKVAVEFSQKESRSRGLTPRTREEIRDNLRRSESPDPTIDHESIEFQRNLEHNTKGHSPDYELENLFYQTNWMGGDE